MLSVIVLNAVMLNVVGHFSPSPMKVTESDKPLVYISTVLITAVESFIVQALDFFGKRLLSVTGDVEK